MPNLADVRSPSLNSVMLATGEIDNVICCNFKATKAHVEFDCYSSVIVHSNYYVVSFAFTQQFPSSIST